MRARCLCGQDDNAGDGLQQFLQGEECGGLAGFCPSHWNSDSRWTERAAGTRNVRRQVPGGALEVMLPARPSPRDAGHAYSA